MNKSTEKYMLIAFFVLYASLQCGPAFADNPSLPEEKPEDIGHVIPSEYNQQHEDAAMAKLSLLNELEQLDPAGKKINVFAYFLDENGLLADDKKILKMLKEILKGKIDKAIGFENQALIEFFKQIAAILNGELPGEVFRFKPKKGEGSSGGGAQGGGIYLLVDKDVLILSVDYTGVNKKFFFNQDLKLIKINYFDDQDRRVQADHFDPETGIITLRFIYNPETGNFTELHLFDPEGRLTKKQYYDELGRRTHAEYFYPDSGIIYMRHVFDPATGKMTQFHFFNEEGKLYKINYFDDLGRRTHAEYFDPETGNITVRFVYDPVTGNIIDILYF